MHSWKVHLVGYNFIADNMGLSSYVSVVASQICEIKRNSVNIRTYSSSKSSEVIDLDASQKCICNFVLVIIITLAVSWRMKLEKTCFSYLTLVWRHRSVRAHQNFWMKLIHQQPERCGYCTWILTSPAFDLGYPPVWQTDGRTDGR